MAQFGLLTNLFKFFSLVLIVFVSLGSKRPELLPNTRLLLPHQYTLHVQRMGDPTMYTIQNLEKRCQLMYCLSFQPIVYALLEGFYNIYLHPCPDLHQQYILTVKTDSERVLHRPKKSSVDAALVQISRFCTLLIASFSDTLPVLSQIHDIDPVLWLSYSVFPHF